MKKLHNNKIAKCKIKMQEQNAKSKCKIKMASIENPKKRKRGSPLI